MVRTGTHGDFSFDSPPAGDVFVRLSGVIDWNPADLSVTINTNAQLMDEDDEEKAISGTWNVPKDGSMDRNPKLEAWGPFWHDYGNFKYTVRNLRDPAG